MLIYDKQAIGKRVFKKTGKIVPSGRGIEMETKVSWEALDQVRIIPRGSCYVVKDLHHSYNQQRAQHQSRLARQNRKTSRKVDRITTKRNRRVAHYLHTASRRIIDLLVAEGIGTLLIGKNRLWKQEVEMGKKNTQQFVQIPHARFIDLLT